MTDSFDCPNCGEEAVQQRWFRYICNNEACTILTFTVKQGGDNV